jgi:hypothetical protein
MYKVGDALMDLLLLLYFSGIHTSKRQEASGACDAREKEGPHMHSAPVPHLLEGRGLPVPQTRLHLRFSETPAPLS